MERCEKFEEFSLLGGPVHRLGQRLGLVRGGTNTIALGLVVGAPLWVVMIALAVADGVTHQVVSLVWIGMHVRLLVAIPLFFLCEAMIDPRFTAFIQEIVRAEVVTPTALPTLRADVARITRWKNSWAPETIFFLGAVLLSFITPPLTLTGVAVAPEAGLTVAGMSLTGAWYWYVCVTVFRFLLLRWVWRLGLWCYLLWRVSKLPLRLVPTHPDGAAGTGFLEVVHLHFIPMTLAISAVQAASFTEEIAAGTMEFAGIYPAIVLILVVDAALFIGPLLIFYPKLWACRVQGMSDYMAFAERYVSDFDRKWLGAGGAPRSQLLGTPDLQSLADLSNSFNVVRNMHAIPMSKRLFTEFAIAALLPMLPLLLLRYPLSDLAEKFFSRLSGL